MKRYLLGLLLLLSFHANAQNAQLLGHSWHLQQIVVEDQIFLYPNQGHSSQIEFFEDRFSMDFPVCKEIAIDDIIYTGEDAFALTGSFLALIGFCSHQSMDWHYSFYAFLNQTNGPFTYVVSTQDNHDFLIVTNVYGHQAFYADAQLAAADFQQKQFGLFFNPGHKTLEFPGFDTNQLLQLTVYNQVGQAVFKGRNIQNGINISTFSNGIYFAKLQLRDGTMVSRKFLKY